MNATQLNRISANRCAQGHEMVTVNCTVKTVKKPMAPEGHFPVFFLNRVLLFRQLNNNANNVFAALIQSLKQLR